MVDIHFGVQLPHLIARDLPGQAGERPDQLGLLPQQILPREQAQLFDGE